MKDSYERNITYLRLSVTQRCQLNCRYCQNHATTDREELTRREISQIVTSMAEQGIRKVRLTGGEPLIREDIISIVEDIRNTNHIEEVGITTNGILLDEKLDGLKRAGITSVNVSLDTLDIKRYQDITGFDRLATVMSGIEKTEAMGIAVKINTVLMRGINDDEVDSFIELTRKRKRDVRFIELMPMNNSMEKSVMDELRISGEELLHKYPLLIKEPDDYKGQPACLYRMPGYKGRVGFINPVSQCFCQECNRIRVLSNGMIRPCLGSDKTFSLKEALRSSEKEVESVIHQAILQKPEKYEYMTDGRSRNSMSQIGG